MKKFLLLLFCISLNAAVYSQITCNPNGNVVLYSNYDGGQLDINVDVNIPNLKIGVVSYEPVTVNLTGTYIANVTEVQFAGYVATTNNHCVNTPAQTNINGAPAGTDTIIFMPNVTVTNPNGYYIIICNYSCDSSTSQGGCNTPDQVAGYFQQEFGGTLRYHYTQYGCWTGTYNISAAGNCCIGAFASSAAPVTAFQSSDTSFCDKQCIDFTDLSTNNPTSWQWFFPGADSTTSTLQNPTGICYNNYGSFDVTLIACNAVGCDTLLMPGFINEFALPVATITQSNDTLFASPGVSYQWWSVDSGAIAGATNSYFIPTYPGDFFAIVTDSVGCNGTSNVITVTNTSVEELSVVCGLLSVVPNPFTSTINITIQKQSKQQVSFTIKNILGEMVYYQQENNLNAISTKIIDLSFLQKGIYILEVSVDGERLVRKIMKE